VAGLVRDGAGNLYGTAADFGAYNHGVVFELFWNGTKYKYKVLHNFCVDAAAGCADGANPWGGLIVDTNGNLYGTTQFGGSSSDAACQSTGCGVAFELVKASKYKFQKLYTFCSLANCADGENPVVGLTYTGAATGTPYDGTSALYGTATYGGLSGNGVAFQLTFVSGQYKRKWKVLNSFSGSDGSMPREMIADANGNIFGVANRGGANGGGDLFEFSPSGKGFSFTVLYNFNSLPNFADGWEPTGAPAIDGQGRLVGTTSGGGPNGSGVLYRIVPNGTNSQETVLYTFCSQANCTDGSSPYGGVTIGASGIFGTTQGGGANCEDPNNYHSGCGVIFQYNNRYPYYNVLHNFCPAYPSTCTDGSDPTGNVILDSSGNLYGTTQLGGNNNVPSQSGTVFKLAR
jgi:uncharacterized repeat protein (TIGR03803 family)